VPATATPAGDRAAARHAVVTGGSQGIGLAVARLLAERGYALTLIARRPKVLRSASAALAARGHPVGIEPADVTDGAALAAAIARAAAARGPCHTLVAAAGAVTAARFEDLDEGEFRALMEVNYFGAVAAVRAVYGTMRARGEGRIGVIASAAALVGIYGYTAYAGSKFALRGFAEALRGEARGHGITVSICYPGDTDTEQYAVEAAGRPPETQAIAGGASLADPAHVARAMVRGMERGTFAIYPGARVAALGRTASLIAPVLNAGFDRVVRRLRRPPA